MPELLKKSYRDKLVTWIGRPCHFQLLYKISRDGCSASTFHQICDGQGATVTVLYNTNKTIYGGYLSQSWHSGKENISNPKRRHLREEYYFDDQEDCNSNGACIYDPDAFIFRLQYNGLSNPMKFPVSNASHAGYGKIGYGPTFGSGHDICTFSGTITSSGNAFSLNGHCNLGNSFSLNGENRNTITNNNMKVTDLEVYKVLDRPGQRILEKPWREHEDWTTKKTRSSKTMPELLKKSYRDKLVTWIGRPCHFQLLYKISRDGCSASTFHQICDGQGATVTVLYNTNKTIYGGYLSQSWHSGKENISNPKRRHLREEYYFDDQEDCNSNGACIYDPDAFIFRLQYNGLSNPMKFPVSNASHAGYGKIGYGPTFGSGHDICTFSGTITSSGNAFSLNGHCNLGNSFSLNGENRNTITNNNMKVTDLEVYKVLDRPGQRILEKPWREHEDWTTKKTRSSKTMPELLKKSYRDKLVTWIGRPCHFQLLYKISRDGCSASTFHQICDGQGATVTVLYNTNKTIYGGYLSQSWHSGKENISNPKRRHLREEYYFDDQEDCNSNGACIYDPDAFIFRLQYNGLSNPMKFPVSNASHAGYGKIGYGPTFGSGHDICTFSGTITSSGNAFSLNGHCNLGNSFSLNGENRNTITNNNMKVTDLEVYKVLDGPGQRILEKPWREHEDWTTKIMQELKKTLLNYKPMTETNVPAANILLIGQIGAGKTSFFNSVNSLFRGKITSKACSGSFEHSVTTMYRQYKVKDFSEGTFLNFRLCDTRGFEEEFALDAQEMSFILDGNIPDRYQFNPLVPFTPDTLGYINDPNLKDKTHCVAFVIDGSTVDVMSDTILQRLKDLQVKMNHRGLPQVVFLTKLDKICPDVNEDVKNTFTSSAVCDAVDKVADVMGLPRAHVLPVKNYESETKLKTAVDILLMEALQRCLDFADDYMEEQLEKMAAEGKNVHTKDYD